MVDIAYAPPDAREEVAQFMLAAFPRARWSIDGWRRLLDGRWSGPEGRYAITVRDSGKIVGVLGMVTAERLTDDGPRTTANMSSWYLLKPYRGRGLGRQMLEFAFADPGITVTNFSSARDAVPVVERAGMQVLDHARLIWQPRKAATLLPVNADPLAQSDALGARDRRVLIDHAGLNLKPLVVETPDGPVVIILSIKQKHDAYVTHEVMYLGDRERFARHVRAITDSLLPPDRAVLSVDRRFLPGEVTPDATEAFAVPRFYVPGGMPPEAVDHLYSEIVLLDMKLY